MPPPVEWPHRSEFPIALRGYDRPAVDGYLDEVAQTIEDMEALHYPDAAVKRALEQVGEETSSILKRARETEVEITSKSRAKADDLLETAEREARQMRSAAEAEVRRLDQDTERLWEERQRLLADIGRISGELSRVADAADGRFPLADAGAGPRGAEAGAVEVLDGNDEDEPVEEDAAELVDEPIGAGEPGVLDDDPLAWPEEDPLREEDDLAWAEDGLVGDQPGRGEAARNGGVPDTSTEEPRADAAGTVREARLLGEPPVWEGEPIAIRRFSNPAPATSPNPEE